MHWHTRYIYYMRHYLTYSNPNHCVIRCDPVNRRRMGTVSLVTTHTWGYRTNGNLQSIIPSESTGVLGCPKFKIFKNPLEISESVTAARERDIFCGRSREIYRLKAFPFVVEHLLVLDGEWASQLCLLERNIEKLDAGLAISSSRKSCSWPSVRGVASSKPKTCLPTWSSASVCRTCHYFPLFTCFLDEPRTGYIQPESITLFFSPNKLFYNNNYGTSNPYPNIRRRIRRNRHSLLVYSINSSDMAELEEKEDRGGARRHDDDLGYKYGRPSVPHKMPARFIYLPSSGSIPFGCYAVVQVRFEEASTFGHNYDSRNYTEFQCPSPNPTTNFWCPLTRHLDPDSRLQQVIHLNVPSSYVRLSVLTSDCD